MSWRNPPLSGKRWGSKRHELVRDKNVTVTIPLGWSKDLGYSPYQPVSLDFVQQRAWSPLLACHQAVTMREAEHEVKKVQFWGSATVGFARYIKVLAKGSDNALPVQEMARVCIKLSVARCSQTVWCIQMIQMNGETVQGVRFKKCFWIEPLAECWWLELPRLSIAMICCPNAEVDPVAVAPEIIGHCNEDLEGNDHAGIVQQMSIIVHHDSLDASFRDGELICNMERSGVQRPKEVAVVLTEPEEKEVEQEMLPFHQDSTRIRCDSDQFARGTSTMSKKSTKSSSSSKFQKMQSGSFLEVHHELRAIPLRKSLRLAWKIWLGGKCDLWEVAVPVKRYDVFLSHTWRTRGVWKILSLVFQFGLPWLFLFWFLGVCLAIALCMLDILPLPHTRMLGEIPCPTGPWVLTFSAIGSALGLFLASLKDGKNEWCFIDKVSIHQTDPELKEEGIYGIGGALGCTKELRILWSAPYLSRRGSSFWIILMFVSITRNMSIVFSFLVALQQRQDKQLQAALLGIYLFYEGHQCLASGNW